LAVSALTTAAVLAILGGSSNRLDVRADCAPESFADRALMGFSATPDWDLRVLGY
jgi:hypothetical protein